MEWNCLSIPKLRRLHRWSLGMEKQFHSTLYWACEFLSMLGLKLKGPWNDVDNMQRMFITPFRNLKVNFIPERTGYYISQNIKDEITYPSPNFSSEAAEIWTWISNIIPHLTGNVITNPCCNQDLSVLVTWVPGPKTVHRKRQDSVYGKGECSSTWPKQSTIETWK